jgi:hypothetical protein
LRIISFITYAIENISMIIICLVISVIQNAAFDFYMLQT